MDANGLPSEFTLGSVTLAESLMIVLPVVHLLRCVCPIYLTLSLLTVQLRFARLHSCLPRKGTFIGLLIPLSPYWS